MPASKRVWALIAIYGLAAAPLGRAWQEGYRRGSLDSDQVQAVYATDPQDSWNHIFHALFTRPVSTRLTGDFPEGAPFHTSGAPIIGLHSGLAVSDGMFERIESGDRAIDPLYPSFLNSLGTRRLFSEPYYSEFTGAIQAALQERRPRAPVARALMQSDLWAAYDIIFGNPRAVDNTRRDLILNRLAHMIQKLALTGDEAAKLTDNFAAAMTRFHLPDLFGDNNSWVEIEFEPSRLHDSSANYRRSTRVFLNPGPKVSDPRSLLESFRADHTAHAPLEAVALVTQCLLIGNTGALAPSRITTDVQIRRFSWSPDGKLSKTEISEFELSRRSLLTNPESGGFLRFDETSPAYLAAAGNDYSFASGVESANGRALMIPIMGSLRTRCSGCHGEDVANLFTFSRQNPAQGQIKVLNKREFEHAAYVIGRKMPLESWKSLRERWLQN